jgi:hypothetical protein
MADKRLGPGNDPGDYGLVLLAYAALRFQRFIPGLMTP